MSIFLHKPTICTNLCTLIAALMIASCSSAVLQVSVSGEDSGACTGTPCATITYAISQASSGDTIELQAGTFRGPGNRNIKLGITNTSATDLKIKSSAGPDQSILDLERAGRGFQIGEFAGAAVVEGITLINGACKALNETEDRNGAGIHLVNTHAEIHNMRIRDMDCTVEGVEYTKWSGAAIYLKDSHAKIDGVIVSDSVANHGGAVGTWGNDRSRVLNSIFLRTGGLRWGGALITEDNSSTEFHNCRFSYSHCAYGGALDDGGTAHPLFRNCTFEYGESTYGAAAFHYGQSKTRFEHCIFQHNVMNAGTVYINAETKPELTDCLFYNNSATGEAGGIRSYYTGKDGPLVVERVRFISNFAKMFGGAILMGSNAVFNDCWFEDNHANSFGGAMVIQPDYGEGHGLTFKRTTWLRNRAASTGGAIHMLTLPVEDRHRVTFDTCTFRNNEALSSGGAIQIRWGLDVVIVSSIFDNNKAMNSGGALHLSNLAQPLELNLLVTDTNFTENSASSGGGALSCEEPVPLKTHVTMNRFLVFASKTFGNGAGFHYSCSALTLTDGVFMQNEAFEGNGGAAVLSSQLDCNKKGNAEFQNVQFHGNYAREGGGVLFFDHTSPACQVPMLADGLSWNTSATDVWSWTDFHAAVHGNEATYGKLQATAPSEIRVRCTDSSSVVTNYSGSGACFSTSPNALVVDGFPGVELQLKVALIDDFGQEIVAAGLQVEMALPDLSQASGYRLKGLQRRALEAGIADVEGLRLIGGHGNDTSNFVQVLVRIPRGMASLRNVRTASVDVMINLCPAGYKNDLDSDSKARKCTICSSGRFSHTDDADCTACPSGKYANESGSSMCRMCPAGTGCPAGTTQPAPCSAGFYQELIGSAACVGCSKGTYQERAGASYCHSCNETQTTEETRSVSAMDCGCPEQTYKHNEICRPCPDGLKCPGFGGDFTVEKGFYAEVPIDPSLGVWTCESDIVCVGQVASNDPVCAELSTGLNCALCKDGAVKSSDGTCEDCGEGGRTAILPIFALVGFLAVGAFHYFWNHKTKSVEMTESILASVTIGDTLGFMQQLGILSRMTFVWPGEFREILDFVKVFLFNLDYLKIGCIVPVSFPGSYLVGLTIPLVLAGAFLLWLVLSKCIHVVVSKFPAFGFSAICNSMGMVLQALYISVVSAIVSMFICFDSGPEGERVLTNYPWELCYKSTWFTMLPFGILAILVSVVGFFTLLCWLTHVAPSKWDDEDFRIRIRFLVFKFRTDTWWFSIPILIRAVAMAMVPVVEPDDGYVQFFLLTFVLVAGLVAHLMVRPYAEASANHLETLELSFLLVILLLGSWFIEDRDYDGEDKAQADRLSTSLCSFFAACVLTLFGFFIYAVNEVVRPEHLAAKRKKVIDAVHQAHTQVCQEWMAIDDEVLQQKILREASYVDLENLMTHIDFHSTIFSGGEGSKIPKRRLSTTTVTKQVSKRLRDLDAIEAQVSERLSSSKSTTSSSPKNTKLSL